MEIIILGAVAYFIVAVAGIYSLIKLLGVA
jgi:hypothetical protein